MVKTHAISAENTPFDGENAAFEWRVSHEPVAYEEAVREMESRVQSIHEGRTIETIWLLEHPPVYTAGTSAVDEDLLTPDRFPVIETGRGGQYTYHGPGQRIAYVMLDLSRRKKDVRAFVCKLEDAVIATLADFGITGERRQGRVGVWVPRPDKGPACEDKIAAIGVRVRRWVTFHGLSLNVHPKLEHYSGIVPCGVQEHGVTSLADLGRDVTMKELDRSLSRNLARAFELDPPAHSARGLNPESR